MSEKNNTIAQLEAMLFAAGDPVEPEKLADVLKLDIENVIKMLGVFGGQIRRERQRTAG